VTVRTGRVKLTDVGVDDEQSPACNRTFGTLAAHSTRTYTCAHERVRKRFVNVASVLGDGRDPIVYTKDARATVTVP
jgi:hypothetical protein